MTDNVLESMQANASEFPRTTAMIRTLLERSPMFLRGQLAYLMEHRAAAFWPEAERLVGLAEAVGGSPAESLVEYTVTYLKEQIRFLQTKEYTHTDFESARKAVYDNPEVMEKFYLEGLLLTHAFWPIHLDIHKFFREEFLSRLPSDGVGTEFGFGHGLYLLDVLLKLAPSPTLAAMISAHFRRNATPLSSYIRVGSRASGTNWASQMSASVCRRPTVSSGGQSLRR